jgi:hypothetical protein
MIHGIAFAFGLAAGVLLVGRIVRRGLARTIVDFFKVVVFGVVALATVVLIAVVVFHLISVEPETQASARAPAGNWLTEEQSK